MASGVSPTKTNLAANGTTVIKGTSGILYAVFINTPGASSNVLTLYDNTAASGTKIATIDTTTSTAPQRLYNLVFNTGLTAVMATGTAADVTITWE